MIRYQSNYMFPCSPANKWDVAAIQYFQNLLNGKKRYGTVYDIKWTCGSGTHRFSSPDLTQMTADIGSLNLNNIKNI